jgi:hypothetical protein
MVEFDITDYLAADSENYKELRSWLSDNVGSLDVTWYCQRSQYAHKYEGEGKGWAIRMCVGKTFRKNSFPYILISWILELKDDLAAVQFKLVWPETPYRTSEN